MKDLSCLVLNSGFERLGQCIIIFYPLRACIALSRTPPLLSLKAPCFFLKAKGQIWIPSSGCIYNILDLSKHQSFLSKSSTSSFALVVTLVRVGIDSSAAPSCDSNIFVFAEVCAETLIAES